MKNENETKADQRERGAAKNTYRKADATRDRILQAARKVFSEQPYHAASLRMIAKEGGFDHPLIRYYFPTKAELFEAVVLQICGEFYENNVSWLEGLEAMLPAEALPLYIDRMFAYHRQNPEGPKIIMQNIAQIDNLNAIPGHNHLYTVFAQLRLTFQEKIPLRGPTKDIDRFFNSFNAVLINYMGASTAHAQVMGMETDSDRYWRWVRRTVVELYLPWLERLAFPDGVPQGGETKSKA
ncbi:MAG: TetR/AcrR family transcriptional regulator [Desulfatibacillaceae bacterium]